MQYKTTLNFYERFQVKTENIIYKSTNEVDLVKEMRSQCFIPSENVYEFMQEFSKRCYKWDRSMVRFDTEKNFIEDLLNTNYLTITKLN